MKQGTALILLGILVIIGINVFYITKYVLPEQTQQQVHTQPQTPAAYKTPAPTRTSTPTPAPTVAPSDVHDAPSVESYVRKHISEFSTVKAQLGGKFYVTRVETHGGAGTVYFEDGHSSYIADFSYSIDDFGTISIDTFVVRT